jgi:hypothetical protein
MSDEPKRRETAEEKEDRRRREIEGLMESMNRTAPKADTELLKSLRQVELSESPDKMDQGRLSDLTVSSEPEPTWRQAVGPAVAPFVSPSTPVEKAPWPSVSLGPSHAKAPNEEPDVEPPGEDVLIARNPELFTVEAAIAEIGRAVREFPYPNTTGRGSVRVSEDVFSRVTMIYAKQRIDKILVLSYLLYRHVPAEGLQRVPRWVLETPPKMPRPRILVFIKDEALARRLSDTAIRFAVTEADIIENTVRKNLPEAPFQYKPKRRMRFTT